MRDPLVARNKPLAVKLFCNKKRLDRFFRTVHAVGIQYIPMITTFLNYFFFTKLNFGFFLEVGFALRVKESKVTLHVCVAFSASVSPLNHVIIQAQLLACYIEQNIHKFLHVLGG